MTDACRQIIDILSRCKRVLLTTHVRPDGDAIGTVAALSLALRKAGIDSQVLLFSPLPPRYAFVFGENHIAHLSVEKSWPDDFSFDCFDALLVADTGTWSQLPGLKEKIENWRAPRLVLDHHLTQQDWADVKLVVAEAAAAGEIAAELIQRWPIPLDADIATALFVAIASDTGWFQFSNTRPATLRLAATLVEKGVDTDRIYKMLYQNERPQRVALLGRMLQSLELLVDHRLAVMKISLDDFAQTGADPADTENLINVPMQIGSVEVSALLVEQHQAGPTRLSLRSKGGLDCASFVRRFAGGGHARAAGAKIDAPLQAARDAVVAALLEAMR